MRFDSVNSVGIDIVVVYVVVDWFSVVVEFIDDVIGNYLMRLVFGGVCVGWGYVLCGDVLCCRLDWLVGELLVWFWVVV